MVATQPSLRVARIVAKVAYTSAGAKSSGCRSVLPTASGRNPEGPIRPTISASEQVRSAISYAKAASRRISTRTVRTWRYGRRPPIGFTIRARE